jgi:hypothetical protein
MKTIMEFNLPDDRYELELAQKAWNFKSTLDKYDNLLRNIVKYGNVSEVRDKLDTDVKIGDSQIMEVAEALRSLLTELTNDNNARMDDE